MIEDHSAPAGDGGERVLLADVLPGESLDPPRRTTRAEVRRSLLRLGRRRKLQARNMYRALTIGFESGLLEPSALLERTARRRP